MKEFKYTITDSQGIHARPAGLLVKEAAKFASDIKIEKAGMGLAAKQGEEVVIRVEGADEAEAAAAMETFFKENL